MGEGDEARRIEARPRWGSPAPRCPYCREELEPADAQRACPVCAANHHADCWVEVGRCAACVHRSAAPPARVSVSPRPGGPLISSPRQGLAAAVVVLLVVLGAAGGVLAWVARRETTPRGDPLPAAAASFAPDQSHVRVGQRYTFQQSGHLTTVLTVLWVTPHAVAYRTSTTRDGVAEGEDHQELWERPTPGVRPGSPLPRERRRFGEVELECVQRQVGSLRLWIAVTDGTDADERFPGTV